MIGAAQYAALLRPTGYGLTMTIVSRTRCSVKTLLRRAGTQGDAECIMDPGSAAHHAASAARCAASGERSVDCLTGKSPNCLSSPICKNNSVPAYPKSNLYQS